MTETSLSSGHIPYASPDIRPRSRVAPAVWISIIGLALIGLGGCFMIGIMEIITPHVSFGGPITPNPTTPSFFMLLFVLYAAAFGCFGGALILVFKGVMTLFKIIGE